MVVEGWVRELVEDGNSCAMWRVGDTIKHPEGYLVKLIDGQFWGSHGVSNFWYWRRVLKSGALSRKIFSGYGWQK